MSADSNSGKKYFKRYQLIKTSLVVFAAASIIAAIFAFGSGNNAYSIPTTLYGVDFEDPPHVVNNPPATGPGSVPRDTVSNSNNAVVSPPSGSFTSQLVRLGITQGTSGFITFDLEEFPSDFYTSSTQFSIVDQSGGYFRIIYTTSAGGGVIEFREDGSVWSYTSETSSEQLIGTYNGADVTTVESQIDLSMNSWDISVTGNPILSRDFDGSTGIIRMIVETESDLQGIIDTAVDNVVISAEMEPEITPTIEVIGDPNFNVIWNEEFDMNLLVTGEEDVDYTIQTDVGTETLSTPFTGTGSPDPVTISYAYPKEASGNSYNVVIELIQNPTVATNGDINVNVGPHATRFASMTLGSDSEEWYNDNSALLTLVDSDAGDAPIADASIRLTGEAVDGEPLTGFTTDADGEATIPFIVSQATGIGKAVTGEYDGDEAYEAATPITTQMTVELHDITLSEPTLQFSSKEWYAANTASTVATDSDASGVALSKQTVTPENPPGLSVTFDGDAVDSPVTALTGSPAEATFIVSQNTGSDKSVDATSAETTLYKSGKSSTSMTVELHDVSLSNPVLGFDSLEWYFSNTATTEPTDTDAAGVDPSKQNEEDTPTSPTNILVTFNGAAVDTAVSDLTGSEASATFIVSQNTGDLKSVVATSTATLLYKSTTSGTTMTVLKHDIELSLAPIADEFWDLDTLFTGGATDTDAGGIDPSKTTDTPLHPAGLSISFTGPGADSVAGLGSAGIASVLTVAGGTYSATGFAPYAPPATDWEVMTHSAETALYLPDDSPSIFYDTLKHTTLLDLNFRDEIINVANAGHPGNPLDPSDDIISFVDSALTPATTDLRSVQEDRRFAIGGTLIDTAYPFTDIAAKPVHFEFDPGVSGLAAVTTTPVEFEGSNIAVDTCPVGASDCSRDALDPFGGDATPDSNTYVSLGVGDKINFPSGTLNAALYLQNNGDNNFSYLVHHEDASTRAGCVTTTDNDFLHVPVANINPIPDVDGIILPVAFELTQDSQDGSCPSPADTLNIAAMLLKADDARNPPTLTYALNFENEVTGSKSSPFEVHTGAFTTFGLAGQPAEDLMVRALFDEDRDYLASDKTGFIDILTTTETSGTVGAGGSAVVVTEDTPDFTSYPCSMPREIGGNDLDFDGICDEIEISNRILDGGADLALDPDGLHDVSILTKDIYVEMDGMSGYLYTQTTVDEIEDVFETAPLPPADFDGIQRPYVLHIIRDESFTASFPTKVWTDTSSSWLSGTPSVVRTDSGGGDTSREFTISGLKVRTSGQITGTAHQVEFKLLADFSAAPGITSASVTTDTLGSGKSANIATLTGAYTVGAGATTDKKIITVTLSFTTSCVAPGDCALDTDAEGDLGTSRIDITMPSTKTGVTLDSLTLTSGTPNIVNNNDFDGIKKNFFGTKAERDLSGGTLGQRVANLVAKLSYYHYVEAVRTTGATTTVCGSSGWAEDGGNDIIVSLGERSGGTDCFTGTAGSINEQKGTFLHELGHNLGLHHGGNDDLNCKVNYPSVMSYARQIPVSTWDVFRADYSREVLAIFDERTLANGGVGINENLGNGLEIDTTLYPAGTSTIRVVYGNGVGAARTATIGASPADIDFDGDTVFDEFLRPFDISRLTDIRSCHLSGTNSELTGYNDWANLHLPFVESGVLHDGVTGDVDGEGFTELFNEGNQGIFSGLLSPIVQVSFDDLPDGVKQYPATGTAKLQFTYERLERDGGGLYPPSTVLKARLFKIAQGITEPDPALTKVPVPLKGSNLFRFDDKNKTWVYNLDLSSLDRNFIYGVQVWRDGTPEDGGGLGPLDNNGDRFAGFFFVKK